LFSYHYWDEHKLIGLWRLQLYRESGIKTDAFNGVPVFQAEGLTVKTEKNRYTPLFFNKDDLDLALGNARAIEEVQEEKALRARCARAEQDLEMAKDAVRTFHTVCSPSE
jgi:Tic22-like family